MARKDPSESAPLSQVSFGENPVDKFRAREYAKESSPSTIAVLLELTENARDNGTDVTLTIDISESRRQDSRTIIIPRKIICTDNGPGLTHAEFLNRFCGAFSDSDAHHDVDRAGRNGVGTKTYLSIAEQVIVRTTTGRPTEGLQANSDDCTETHRKLIESKVPSGILIPKDGEPDCLWRAYEYLLHTRGALPGEWQAAEPQEMGTIVELCRLIPGTEVPYEVLLERLSYAREWLHHSAHSLTLQLTGNVPPEFTGKRRVSVRPWKFPEKNWLVRAQGLSNVACTVFDDITKKPEVIEPCDGLPGVLEFDFRVVGRDSNGQMQNLQQPALLFEICGALPYSPNLDSVQSARNINLLTFVGLEHASSIGAFCNSVCGWARINALPLKQALRNNKTTLATGPGSEVVDTIRHYLHSVLKPLHRVWYNATRSSQDEAARDAVKEAEEEVNLALRGVNRNAYRTGTITRHENAIEVPPSVAPPRRHRWECGACRKRWLADSVFTPRLCAETDSASGPNEGCQSTNIGLAKNQPRVGDCKIKIEQLGDRKIPASFQVEREGEDLDLPVVTVNLASPRYIELRGPGSMSGQAQTRLKQYLVDVSLVAIAEFNSRARGTDLSEELGELYFNRMLRSMGIKKYEQQLSKVLNTTDERSEELALV